MSKFISRLDDLIKDLKSAEFEFAADFDKTTNGEIKVEGLIGIDTIQHMESFQKINCMLGIIPFGMSPIFWNSVLLNVLSLLECQNVTSVLWLRKPLFILK